MIARNLRLVPQESLSSKDSGIRKIETPQVRFLLDRNWQFFDYSGEDRWTDPQGQYSMLLSENEAIAVEVQRIAEKVEKEEVGRYSFIRHKE